MIATTLLAGCASPPVNTSLLQAGRPQTMRQVMECKDKLVFLSAGPVNRARPVLVLLHGATSDPTEMLQIFTEYQNQYNVFLYSFNFHQPVKKVAGDLVGELQALKSEIESAPPRNLPVGDVTVVDYLKKALAWSRKQANATDPSGANPSAARRHRTASPRLAARQNANKRGII